jgi:hypothetical protein
MRTIKFRAWRENDDGEMAMIDGDSLAYEEYAPITELLSQEGVMQFTGKRDRHGIEIYEGDILKMPYSKKNKIVEYGKFFNCGCCGDFAGIGFDFEEKEFDKVEIIGNIYENPELLSE